MGKLIIANWKLNPATEKEAVKLAKESDLSDLIICPPFTYLEAVAKVLKKAKLGAQDLFWEEKGAYTGEVSGTQLKDAGAEYVIIGHSERRQNMGETDEMVAKKIEAAVRDGLAPILCVGETRAERDAGKTKEVVGRELKIGLSLVKTLHLKPHTLNPIVIAYEPIWAVGSGHPDTPEDMLEMVQFIKNQLISYAGATVSEFKNSSTHQLINSSKIIYGGSVTSQNAQSFLKQKEIAGALVGSASLNSKEIKKIVEIANAK